MTDQENSSQDQGARIRKPPPITPRRFTKFFTPRPRNALAIPRTSRAALRTITSSSLNSRTNRVKEPRSSQGTENDQATPRGRKRKLSFVLADNFDIAPVSRISASFDPEIRSSPTIPEHRSPLNDNYRDVDICETDEETDVEFDEDQEDIPTEPQPRILPYRSKTTSGGLLSARLSGRKIRAEVTHSQLWQQETGNFYSSPNDINATHGHPSAALPFSVAACNTNSLIAVGDEEGQIRLIDAGNEHNAGMTSNYLTMRPHDNALMDLEFSQDDSLLATACGDQTCQIIDMQTQTSLYTLGDHRCSVKKVAFQPRSGNQVLASCGRDGQINFWDLRCNNNAGLKQPRRPTTTPLPMTQNMKYITSTHSVRDAHMAGPKSKATGMRRKANMIPGRNDFSITSLSFLGENKPHLLVTASEIDTAIKVWDIRTSFGTTRRDPNPLSITEEPKSHAHHRSFGVTSLVLNTDGSRLYALSRDHTVYAYATSHLVLGSSPRLSITSKASRATEFNEGLGPLYGFRHPNLHVQTFWPRLAIRRATDSNTELLAVGSSDDCAVLFPTNERYLNKSLTKIQPLHLYPNNTSQSSSTTTRPQLTRQSSSFTKKLYASYNDREDTLPIYQHGTPLARGHDKEVTSLAWNSEGSLITASDDYTVRCWRENPNEARRMRTVGEKSGARWRSGWSVVGTEGYDDDE